MAHAHRNVYGFRAAPVRKFKGATVYDWDSEPAAERPSAFVESVWASTATSAWARSGRAATLEVRRARPAHKRGGIPVGLALALLATAAVAGGGLFLLVRWLPLLLVH